MNIKITADSTCDLTPELIDAYHITITPLAVSCGSENFKDGVDITPDALYEKIAATGELSSTAAVNVQEYIDVFSEALQEYDAVIHFTISSAMSACYQ
ncbi:MAG: DegV family protein, partial [Oscillospiraceae bacterium]|nr:DegV family protein [Oscillospiraceae bacterium]